MTLSTYFSFLALVLLIELTPGPNMAWLAVTSAQRGRAAGFLAVAGITLGLSLQAALAATGVAQLLLAWPAAGKAMHFAGAAVLLWLARESWKPGGQTSFARAETTDGRGPLWQGLVINMLNVKALVFYVSLLPSFMNRGEGSVVAQAVILSLTSIAVSMAVHATIVLGAARATTLLRRSRLLAVRRASAVMLVLTAAWIAFGAFR